MVDPERASADPLENVIADVVARAVAAWPDVVLDRAVFIRAVSERLRSGDPVGELAAMHTDDLYLACGCMARDPAALAGFEASYGGVIARALASSGTAPGDRADVGQIVRLRLLVAPPDGRAPRLASYSARGSLRSWVRVVATREAARVRPRARREIVGDDDDLAAVLAGEADPELRYLKRRYREEFKRAFQAALDALDHRLRLVIQQHALDGLGIDQLAAIHGVHRSTAARWIQAAHEAVLAGTQRELMQHLRLSESEMASVMRLIASQLDVSLSRALRTRRERDPALVRVRD